MNHSELILCVFLGLVVLGVGVWLTVVGYEKSDKYSNKWLEKHKKQLKVVGPILITVGSVIFLCCLLKMIKDSGGYDEDTNDFGFRFY